MESLADLRKYVEDQVAEIEEKDIVTSLKGLGKGNVYEDSAFPASEKSLHHTSGTPEYDSKLGDVKWIRPENIVKNPKYLLESCDTDVKIECDSLDDAWLVGALSLLAGHPGDVIQNLFLTDVHTIMNYGVYSCCFYKNGGWQKVTCDTRLPCISMPSKDGTMRPIYSHTCNMNDMWVPLVEKAYAKLHGSYQALNGGNISEALADLTGGVCDCIDIQSDAGKSAVQTGELWNRLKRYLDWGYIIACENIIEETPGCSLTENGLLTNCAYGIMAVHEHSDVRLLQLRNPWAKSHWTGAWSDKSPISEIHPDGCTAVVSNGKEDSNNKQGGNFWLTFDDLMDNFKMIHICRIFQKPFSHQYSLNGEWVGKTACGRAVESETTLTKDQRNTCAQIQQYLESTSLITVKKDEDPNWFNNPQYCMVVNKPTNILVSLTQQQGQRTSGAPRDYAVIGFDVIRHKMEEPFRHSRVWERTKRNSVTSSSKSFAARTREGSNRGEREVVKGNIMLDPSWAYNILAYTNDQGQEGKFTIRVIAKSEVTVEPVPVTHSLYKSGVWGWQSSRNIDTAGGGLTMIDDKKGIQFNPSWCQNPQYWVKCPEGVQYNDVDIKLVLRREVNVSEETPNHKSPRRRRRSTMHNAMLGMVICRAEPVIGKEFNTPRQWKRHADTSRKNAKGERRYPTENGGALEKETKCLSEKDNSHGRGVFDNETMPNRRVCISDTEWCQASSYGAPYYASVTLPKVKRDWLQNGLIITPSLDQKGVKGKFKLEAHSDELLEVYELSNKTSTTIASEWKKSTSGGCQLRPNWANNPIFHLQMKQAGEFKVNICASRPEKEWSGECSKDRVGSMIGFYIIKGTKLTSKTGLITHNGEAWDSSPFSMSHSVSPPPGFTLNFSGPEEVYSIIPCTYNEGKTGTFFLTVSSKSEFVLRRNQRDPGRQGSPRKSPQSSSKSPTTNHCELLCKINE